MNDETREALAAYAHEAWSGWMRYMWSKATANEDGTLTLPFWAVERWARQMNTPYAELPEAERASDRAEADRMLAIVAANAHLIAAAPDLLNALIHMTEMYALVREAQGWPNVETLPNIVESRAAIKKARGAK